MAGGLVLIVIGIPVMYFSYNTFCSTLSEVKASEAPLTESTQSKMDSVIKGALYDSYIQDPEYNNPETKLTSLIEDVECVREKVEDIGHQLKLALDEKTGSESEILVKDQYNDTLTNPLTGLEQTIRKFYSDYKDVISDETNKELLERYEIYSKYENSLKSLGETKDYFSENLAKFLDAYDSEIVGYDVFETTISIIERVINI